MTGDRVRRDYLVLMDMTKKQYRAWNREQDYLFPPRVRDWLPAGHLAFFVADVMESLDIAPIEMAIQGKDPRGEHPYHRRMMFAVWICGYAVGIVSSRGLERAIQEDVAFRVVASDSRPHFTRLNDFRRVHREHSRTPFVSVLRLCQEAGLIKLGHVAIDGSKIKADASKHTAMTYERMKKERLRRDVARLSEQSRTRTARSESTCSDARRTVPRPPSSSRSQRWISGRANPGSIAHSLTEATPSTHISGVR